MYIKMIVLHRHLQEHMKDFTGDDVSLEAKDQDELEFHYFKLHDYDNNNKLGESLYYTQYSGHFWHVYKFASCRVYKKF